MTFLDGTRKRTWILRTGLAVAAIILLIACINALSRLPTLSSFGLHQYHERAESYRNHLSIVFVRLAPVSLLISGFLMTFGFSKRLAQSVTRIWNNLPEWIFWGILPLLFCLLSAWTARSVIGAVPRVFDAFNYYFQAQNFALGRFYAPAPPIPDLFRFPFIIIDQGKWYGSVYPGYSLLLAAGIKLGADWLTSPVLGGAGVMLMYFATRDMLQVQIAKLVVLLALCSPFFRMMSSIFMAHAAGIVWVTLAVWMLWRWADKKRTASCVTPFLAGFAMAWIYITRPQVGLVALPLFILNAVCKARTFTWKQCMAFAFPLVAAVVFLGYYNYRLTGDAMVNPRYFVDPERRLGFGSDLGEPLFGGDRSGHDPVRGLRNSYLLLTLWNMELLGTGSYGVFGLVSLVIAVLLLFQAKNKLAWCLFSGIGFNAVLYVFYYTPSPNFGPRYFSEMIPASIILFAWGIHEIHKRLKTNRRFPDAPVFMTYFLLVFLLIQVIIVLPVYTGHYGVLPAVTPRHAIREPEKPSVICIPETIYTMNIYTWNSPDLTGNIFIPLKGIVSFQQIVRAFAGRDVYILQVDGTGKYELAPVGLLNELE